MKQFNDRSLQRTLAKHIAGVSGAIQEIGDGRHKIKVGVLREASAPDVIDVGEVGRLVRTSWPTGLLFEYEVEYRVYSGQAAFDFANMLVNAKTIPWDDLPDVNSLWDYIDGEHDAYELKALADEAYEERLLDAFPEAEDMLDAF